jgi:hypothetical protein
MRTQPSQIPARRVLILVVAALLLGAVSVGLDAATSHAATPAIGRQETLRSPTRFPIDFPGRRYEQGATIPRRNAVLRRRVHLPRDSGRRAVRFTCPRGMVALTPGLNDPSEVGIEVTDLGQYKHPRRVFRLWIKPAPARFVKGPTADARVYVLCGPRSEAAGTEGA